MKKLERMDGELFEDLTKGLKPLSISKLAQLIGGIACCTSLVAHTTTGVHHWSDCREGSFKGQPPVFGWDGDATDIIQVDSPVYDPDPGNPDDRSYYEDEGGAWNSM